MIPLEGEDEEVKCVSFLFPIFLGVFGSLVVFSFCLRLHLRDDEIIMNPYSKDVCRVRSIWGSLSVSEKLLGPLGAQKGVSTSLRRALGGALEELRGTMKVVSADVKRFPCPNNRTLA